MDEAGRSSFVKLIEARVAEWEKNITLLGARMAKAKDDADAREKVETMKSRLPVLSEKAKAVTGIPDAEWSEFKSEVDLILEDLIWHQNYVMRRISAS